ncbi:cation:proton antiporter [Sphingomonas morindae]|uniref:Cation:proton antiporter n=1 Tax=Sphingomonas morindae TaxID=1541170 RepID=A0ABY4XDN1_9SPHN|nr:cation:proton antiporter [Sphingomonas morindae]USI75012.1 cation:proton antiporter [Sphingomonas morindae]
MIDLPHAALLAGLGGMLVLATWLPLLLRHLPISLPILFLAAGYGLSFTGWVHMDARQFGQSALAEQLNEAVILIALMGAGLRLDRRFGVRRWDPVWRLLLIAMPLTIGALFLAGQALLGLAAPAALLLAAMLAPTDPVLAADVQTGPPGTGDGGHSRFGLTAEAGLNDGLAMPFVALALALQQGRLDLGHWLGVDIALELVVGAAIGLVLGRGFGLMMFKLPRLKLSDTGEGLAAIGIAFLIDGISQILHGNGFIAVFVAAVAIRSTKPEDAFHGAMADFSEQVERVLVMLVLLLFGWGLGKVGLHRLDWGMFGFVALLMLVVRPAAAMIGFLGAPLPWASRLLMAAFGIRGIGTFFYLQYGLNRAEFPQSQTIWTAASLAVLCSILLHGISATPVMRRADAYRARLEEEAAAEKADADAGARG